MGLPARGASVPKQQWWWGKQRSPVVGRTRCAALIKSGAGRGMRRASKVSRREAGEMVACSAEERAWEVRGRKTCTFLNEERQPRA